MEIPEPRNGPGWIVMRHPASPGQYNETTEEAFNTVWEPKGWVEVTDDDRAATFAGLRKPELVEQAAARGLDTTGTAEQLRERLTASTKET